jgi:hypothetical protein
MNDYGSMVRQLMMAAIPVADKYNPLAEQMNPLGTTEGARGYGGGRGFVVSTRPPRQAQELKDSGIVINPTQADVGRLLRDQRAQGLHDGSVRFFVKDGQVFAWNGSKLTHDNVAATLGVPLDPVTNNFGGFKRGQIFDAKEFPALKKKLLGP